MVVKMSPGYECRDLIVFDPKGIKKMAVWQ